MSVNCGYKIRKLRQESKKTLDQVANDIKISSSALGMYERGMRNPDLKVLLKLSNYFKVELKYLCNVSDDEIQNIKEVLLEEVYSKEELIVAQKRANGNCELCGQRAPFFYNNGEPYLERFIIESNDIKAKKIVLLCPNCKKKLEVLNLPSDKKFLIKVLERDNL